MDMVELLTNFSSEFEIDFTLQDKVGGTYTCDDHYLLHMPQYNLTSWYVGG
jgi:hypothetical protein